MAQRDVHNEVRRAIDGMTVKGFGRLSGGRGVRLWGHDPIYVRGREVEMTVASADERVACVTGPWRIQLTRVIGAGRNSILVEVSIEAVPIRVNLVTTPRQERRPKQQVNDSVDLGKAPRERGIEGPTVLLHVTKAMREAAQAQARMASAPAPTRGQAVALPKKKGGKKG